MKYFITTLCYLIISHCLIQTANADLICAKIINKKGKLSLSSKQVAAAKCPSGYSLITNSILFTGPVGAAGAQGVAGVQGAAGAQGASGTQGPSGASSLNLTSLTFNDNPAGTIFDTNNRLLKNVGSYTKLSSSSKLKLTLSSHVTLINDGTATGYCDLSLLIDSKLLDGTALPSFSSVGGGTASFDLGNAGAGITISHPAVVSGVISGLAAGPHTIGIGYLGYSLSSCDINYGNYSAYIYIEEVETI